MKRTILFFLSLCMACVTSFAQDNTPGKDSLTRLQHVRDSVEKMKQDSIRFAKIDSTGWLPLIKEAKFGGKVFPVKDIDEVPSSKHRYELLFEFTNFKEDSTHEKLNAGLEEISRVINLHIAAGIPLSRIDPVIVAHGAALYNLLTDTAYKVNQKTTKLNPNTKLIEELMNNGVKIIACGQAMLFTDIKKEQLHPGIRVALTAQVVLSDYLGRGYAWYDIGNFDK